MGIMFFRLKATRSGQVLKLIESYRDDTAMSRHRTVASLEERGRTTVSDWGAGR